MDFKLLIRPNILNLKPYSSARHEFSGHGEIFLDANENPFENGVNGSAAIGGKECIEQNQRNSCKSIILG
jgi:histidinol-phosphate/aromatic aminotransferase/cobyric acid decarboxylase-like protein